MKAALVQMVSTPDVAANLQAARGLLEQAARQGAELAVLPEYFCLMGHHEDDKLALGEAWGHGPLQSFLSETAQVLGLWLVAGTIPLAVDVSVASGTERRVYNSTLVFSPDGEQVARYDKIHLFRYQNATENYDEARTLRAGTQPVTFLLPSRDGHVWQIGLSVCYDLRFPELFRAYAALGADLLLVPSAFTHGTGQDHWEVLLRARAIENLSYVGAAAQGGRHENGRQTWGHSVWIDPWGAVTAQCESGMAVVLAELDIGYLRQCRQRLPALTHRVL